MPSQITLFYTQHLFRIESFDVVLFVLSVLCRQKWTNSPAGPGAGVRSCAYEHVQPVHTEACGPSHTGT